MTPDRWRRIKEVLQAAIELEAPERGAFVRTECAGDEAMLAEIEELLRSHDEGDALIERAAAECAALPRKTPSDPSASVNGDSVAAQTEWPSPGLDMRATDPIQGWDRYQSIELIGEGGMGRVYKARDPVLNRPVALKFLRSDDPAMLNRFLQEARIQAQVEHEHVCKVYEVGEVQGRHYIALQYIDGKPLSVCAADLSLEQKIKVMKDATEAVQAAHRIGLIHRDLKPGNIMVERTPEGNWWAYVVDFGLARHLGTEGQTITGMIMGTPCYMSPEQARGDPRQVDRRSDLYSLGATLYQVLSGVPPFDGPAPPEVLMKIVHDEPIRLCKANPAIPIDIETIVMKCIEKEPGRRYQSAKELADDLQRYLDGEPIWARRTHLLYRLGRKARKHTTLVTLAALATIVILGLTAFGLHARWEAAKLAELSEYFDLRAREIESIMRVGYMRPLHDIRVEMGMAKERLREIESEMQNRGSLARGPGELAIGRGHVAMQQWEQALAHLERAQQAGCRDAELGYNLGLVLGQLYERALRRARQADARELQAERVKEAERNYRDPALSNLRQSTNMPGMASAYVEGLIEFYQGDYDDALERARRAYATHPWLAEARRLEGDVLMARGDEKQAKGDYQGALHAYTEADQVYRDLSQTVRSDPSLYEAQARLWASVRSQAHASGLSQSDAYTRVIEACDQALKANPASAAAYNLKSFVSWGMAEYWEALGKDNQELLEQAIRYAEQAIGIDPRDAEGYSNAGTAYLVLAQHLAGNGRDPLYSCSRAIDNLQRADAARPNDPVLIFRLVSALRDLASFEYSAGRDPERSFSLSIEQCKRGISIAPSFARLRFALGYTYILLSEFEMEQGRDPASTLASAVSSLQEVLRINPRHYQTHLVLGWANNSIARCELSRGDDPAASIEKALSCFREAAGISPTPPFHHSLSIQAYSCMAEYQSRQGLDPSDSLEAGRGSFKIAIGLNPKYAVSYQYAGDLELAAARWALKRGSSPMQSLNAAIDHFRKAIDLKQDDASTYASVADACTLRAEWKMRSGQDPGPDIRDGLSAAARAISANRRPWDALAASGALHLLQARMEREPARMTGGLRQAQEELQRAIDRSRFVHPRYRGLLGEARLRLGAIGHADVLEAIGEAR